MSKIYHIKKVPSSVKEWFELNFPKKEGFTYDFYWYGSKEDKVYGCWVYKDGEFWHNSTQARLEWFNENKREKIF